MEEQKSEQFYREQENLEYQKDRAEAQKFSAYKEQEAIDARTSQFRPKPEPLPDIPGITRPESPKEDQPVITSVEDINKSLEGSLEKIVSGKVNASPSDITDMVAQMIEQDDSDE